MLNSKRVLSIFFLAFAISSALSFTSYSHGKAVNHNKSKNCSFFSLPPAIVQCSNSDFLTREQVNFSSKVSSDEEIEEVDESDESLLVLLCTFLVVPTTDKLSLPTRKTCRRTSSQLLVVIPLRAPPFFLV